MKVYHQNDWTERYLVVNEDGKKQRMPRYYREKLFTKMQREIQNDKIREYFDKLSQSQTEEEMRNAARDSDDRKSNYQRSQRKRSKSGRYF